MSKTKIQNLEREIEIRDAAIAMLQFLIDEYHGRAEDGLAEMKAAIQEILERHDAKKETKQ